MQRMCGICSMFRAETGYRGRGVIGNAVTPEDTRVAATGSAHSLRMKACYLSIGLCDCQAVSTIPALVLPTGYSPSFPPVPIVLFRHSSP